MRRFCARLAVFVVVVFLLGSAILALSPTDERKTPRSGVVDELVVQDKGGEKGLKSPRVIKEVEPRYTDDALRARIEGVVALECVVNPDGKVGAVRVVRSLDRRSGLDDEAVWAAKQWRFVPGTLNGVAVPVFVSIEMTFTIGYPNRRPVPTSWPAAFPSDPDVAMNRIWREEELEASGVQMRVDYPEGWTIDKGTEKDYWILFRSDNSRRAVTVSRPVPAPQILVDVYNEGASEAALKRFGDDMKKQVTDRGGHGDVMRVSQARFADRRWIWLEARVSAVDANRLPAGLKPAVQPLQTSAVEAQVWIFTTAVGSHAIVIYCSVARFAADTEDRMKNEVKQAGTEFAAMLRRVSIESR